MECRFCLRENFCVRLSSSLVVSGNFFYFSFLQASRLFIVNKFVLMFRVISHVCGGLTNRRESRKKMSVPFCHSARTHWWRIHTTFGSDASLIYAHISRSSAAFHSTVWLSFVWNWRKRCSFWFVLCRAIGDRNWLCDISLTNQIKLKGDGMPAHSSNSRALSFPC